jgi:hypothetical protein
MLVNFPHWFGISVSSPLCRRRGLDDGILLAFVRAKLVAYFIENALHSHTKATDNALELRCSKVDRCGKMYVFTFLSSCNISPAHINTVQVASHLCPCNEKSSQTFDTFIFVGGNL